MTLPFCIVASPVSYPRLLHRPPYRPQRQRRQHRAALPRVARGAQAEQGTAQPLELRELQGGEAQHVKGPAAGDLDGMEWVWQLWKK